MTYLDVIKQILSSVSSIMLPFGFSFGVLVMFIWSIPLLMRFFKSLF